jgi:hypothetical protein
MSGYDIIRDRENGHDPARLDWPGLILISLFMDTLAGRHGALRTLLA